MTRLRTFCFHMNFDELTDAYKKLNKSEQTVISEKKTDLTFCQKNNNLVFKEKIFVV